MAKYTTYAEVPWYRRSSWNSAFIVLQILTCGFLPLVFVVCLVLATGDIYYDKPDAAGNLKTWSFANKVVAVVILLVNLVLLVAIFGGVLGTLVEAQ